MRLLTFDRFKGQAPIVAPQHLPDGYAQVAVNCKTESGNLVPYREELAEWTPTKAGTVTTIFLYREQYWFHWLTDVHCVKGIGSGDTIDKVYWTGDGAPKMSEATVATAGGGTNYPTNAYDLGIPAPGSAPSLSKSGAPGGNPVVRIYVVTFVSQYGEEGAPSAMSETITVEDGETVDVTTPTAAPAPEAGRTGSHNLVSKRIYRINAGEETAEFQLVAETPLAQAVFSDTVAATSLGEVLPTENFAMPPVDLRGLTVMAGQMMAGFVGKDVYICEPGQPHAWPTDYIFPQQDKVVCLAAFGTSLAVFTEGDPVILTGDHPSSMTRERMEISQACVSAKGVASVGTGALYPSPDGLILVGMQAIANVTEGIIGRDFWQSLKPESIVGLAHDNKYFGFYDNGTDQGGFAYDPKRNELVFLDTYATCGFSDKKTDNLFLVVDNEIVKFDAGAAFKTMEWMGRDVKTGVPTTYGAARVEALGYPVTFTLYADRTERMTLSVPNGQPFRLVGGFRGERWAVKVVSGHELERAQLAATMRDFAGQ